MAEGDPSIGGFAGFAFGVGVAGVGGIEVDAAGLEEFRVAMEQDVGQHFVPSVDRIFSVYSQGAVFGEQNLSSHVQAARVQQHACLNAASRALAGYVNATTVLVTAIGEVKRRYGDADAAVAADVEGVAAIFGQAREDARQARDAALDDAEAGRQASDYAGSHGAPSSPGQGQDLDGTHVLNTGVHRDG